MTETLEIVNFRLKPGTEAAFTAGNSMVIDWLARHPASVDMRHAEGALSS